MCSDTLRTPRTITSDGDPDRGFRLATYAISWIRAAIREYVLGSYSLMKVGTSAAKG